MTAKGRAIQLGAENQPPGSKQEPFAQKLRSTGDLFEQPDARQGPVALYGAL